MYIFFSCLAFVFRVCLAFFLFLHFSRCLVSVFVCVLIFCFC